MRQLVGFRAIVLGACWPLAAELTPPARPCQAQTTGPAIVCIFPAGGQRGTTVEATVIGEGLLGATDVYVSGSGVTAKITGEEKTTAAPRPPGGGKAEQPPKPWNNAPGRHPPRPPFHRDCPRRGAGSPRSPPGYADRADAPRCDSSSTNCPRSSSHSPTTARRTAAPLAVAARSGQRPDLLGLDRLDCHPRHARPGLLPLRREGRTDARLPGAGPRADPLHRPGGAGLSRRVRDTPGPGRPAARLCR